MRKWIIIDAGAAILLLFCLAVFRSVRVQMKEGEKLTDGGTGKAILILLGAAAGIIVSMVTRSGYRKAKDVKDKIPKGVL